MHLQYKGGLIYVWNPGSPSKKYAGATSLIFIALTWTSSIAHAYAIKTSGWKGHKRWDHITAGHLVSGTPTYCQLTLSWGMPQTRQEKQTLSSRVWSRSGPILTASILQLRKDGTKGFCAFSGILLTLKCTLSICFIVLCPLPQVTRYLFLKAKQHNTFWIVYATNAYDISEPSSFSGLREAGLLHMQTTKSWRVCLY